MVSAHHSKSSLIFQVRKKPKSLKSREAIDLGIGHKGSLTDDLF